MTLVKTKTKAPSHYRKVSGSHHRRSPKYMRTYWPYIPIVLILGGSLLAGAYLPNKLTSSTTSGFYGARIEALMGSNNALILDSLYLILFILAFWFVVRHFNRIKNLALEGEQYLARHYFLDIIAGMVIGSIYILVR